MKRKLKIVSKSKNYLSNFNTWSNVNRNCPYLSKLISHRITAWKHKRIYHTQFMLHIHSIRIRIWKGHQPKYIILSASSEHLLVYFFTYIFTLWGENPSFILNLGIKTCQILEHIVLKVYFHLLSQKHRMHSTLLGQCNCNFPILYSFTSILSSFTFFDNLWEFCCVASFKLGATTNLGLSLSFFGSSFFGSEIFSSIPLALKRKKKKTILRLLSFLRTYCTVISIVEFRGIKKTKI